MSDATCPMPQNGEIWVDPALHVTRASDTGEIDGVLAVRREMTEQSDLQDKLASLTRTDGLTGHANRRATNAYGGMGAPAATARSSRCF